MIQRKWIGERSVKLIQHVVYLKSYTLLRYTTSLELQLDNWEEKLIILLHQFLGISLYNIRLVLKLDILSS